MADDDLINQDEIEALLAQAQGGESEEPEPPTDAGAGGGDMALDQSAIEALIAGAPTVEQGSAPAGATMPSSAAPSAATGSDVELLLNRAEEAIASLDQGPAELPPGVEPFQLASFEGTPPNREAATLELVRDVQLDLRIELGRTRMQLEDVLRLRQGAVVALDKLSGDPVDIYANGRLVARGEVLVLNDNFCVRVTELVAGQSAVA
ncbi:MAG: flagellar motor switch protein FliN [Planctomycetota bacterium]